jgi:hypothetical protein
MAFVDFSAPSDMPTCFYDRPKRWELYATRGISLTQIFQMVAEPSARQ